MEKRGDLLDHLSVTYDYPGNVQMTFDRIADDSAILPLEQGALYRR